MLDAVLVRERVEVAAGVRVAVALLVVVPDLEPVLEVDRVGVEVRVLVLDAVEVMEGVRQT